MSTGDITSLSLEDRKVLETVRRGEAQDRIDRLPQHQRETAEREKQQKQEEWQRQMDSVLASQGQVHQLSVSQSLVKTGTDPNHSSEKGSK